MPYEKKYHKLDELTDKALRNEEIKSGAKKANIKDEFFKSKIKEKSSEILEAASKEIGYFNDLEKDLQIAEEKLSKEKPYSIFLNFPENIKNGIIAVSTIIIIGYIVSSYYFGSSFVFSWLVAQSPQIFLTMVIATIILYILYTLSKTYKRDFDAKRKELGIEVIVERIELAEKTADKTILEIGILPELRSIINKHLTSSYDTSLTILTAPGLAEVFDPAYEIPTESKEKLRRLLNIMPGGSIGIAGPRGAGKTTLLLSFCRDSLDKIKDRPVLSIMTSAPVEYEARDFILHIFASVCNQVLALKGGKEHYPWKHKNLQEPYKKSLYHFWNDLRIPLSFTTLGIVLIVFNSFITEWAVAGKTYIMSKGFIFQSGIICLALGILLLSKYSYERTKFLEKMKYENNYGSKNIHDIALLWIQMIRFQSSFSSGWSGSLKFPIAEGGVSNAVSVSQNQLTLPEIIDGYRDFLKLAMQEYLIIIGIDELDKLQSGEKAHRFLNEIKAIFGLENCFYLISVSESAISSFDRRGLPFRDVFDSSFDDIIYVNYLNLEAAKNLIRRRVIGMPIPYVCFCYCMSAGLARDLIRTCRNLLELVQLTPEENNLSVLCGSLIRTDLKYKLRAISIAAKDIILGPEDTQLFEEIHKIEKAVESPHSLFECCSDLLCDIKQVKVQRQESKEVLANRRKLSLLRDELGTYIYYTVTMLELFGKNIDEASFKRHEDSGVFEQLAKARQFLATNSSITRSLITDIRRSENMEIL